MVAGVEEAGESRKQAQLQPTAGTKSRQISAASSSSSSPSPATSINTAIGNQEERRVQRPENAGDIKVLIAVRVSHSGRDALGSGCSYNILIVHCIPENMARNSLCVCLCCDAHRPRHRLYPESHIARDVRRSSPQCTRIGELGHVGNTATPNC